LTRSEHGAPKFNALFIAAAYIFSFSAHAHMYRSTKMSERTTIAKVRASIAAIVLCLSCVTGRADDLSVVGTGEGLDIIEALSAAFMADYPGTYVIAPSSVGSDGAVRAVSSDEKVIGRVARPISLTEQAHGLLYTPVFRLSSGIYVHASVTATNLSSAQLADIFSGRIANWREIGGPNLRIKVVRRQEEESTLIVLRETMPGWRELKFGDRSKLATTAQESIKWVGEVDGAIGFGTYSKTFEPRVRFLRIDGRFPTDADYPSKITIGFIHKEAQISDQARAFLAFVVSPKAKALVTIMGAIPLTE
jgi:phosphate transport system substrate-binding protein